MGRDGDKKTEERETGSFRECDPSQNKANGCRIKTSIKAENIYGMVKPNG